MGVHPLRRPVAGSRFRLWGLAVLALGSAAVLPASATGDYDGCLALAASDPLRAAAEAEAWAERGGGAAATHCQALALQAAGADLRAAALLVDTVRDGADLPPRVQADILAQAGEIYLARGEQEAAAKLASRALGLDRGSVPALALSARERLAAGDRPGALDRLDQALSLDADPALLALRSEVRRRNGDLVGARNDARRAVERAPDRAEGWIVMGSAEAALGNRDAARQAWLRAISPAPRSAEAAEARRRLQRMEAGID